MKLTVSTNSSLNQHLAYVREIFTGTWVNRVDPTKSNYCPVFTVLPQPAFNYYPDELALTSTATEWPENEINQKYAEMSNLEILLSKTFWLEFVHNLINGLLGLMMLGATFFLISFLSPDIVFKVFNNQAEDNVINLAISAQEKVNNFENNNEIEQLPARYLPEQNPNLLKGDWLIIPYIGVNSQLQQTAMANEALETGVWWVPEFGMPGDLIQPMIVSGHRYGWQWWWKTDYWRYHSFYKLPELRPGDLVEIISDQRKWVYEVYAGEEGTEISDYQADLILYTCKYLNSDVRIFRYAKLLDK